MEEMLGNTHRRIVRLDCDEEVASRFRVGFDSIWQQAIDAVKREWDSFEKDQGVNPFASHTRVSAFGVEEDGTWGMSLCWDPDTTDYTGMCIIVIFRDDTVHDVEFVF